MNIRCSCAASFAGEQVGTYVDDQGRQHVVQIVCEQADRHLLRDWDGLIWRPLEDTITYHEARAEALVYLHELRAFHAPLIEAALGDSA